MYLDFEMKEVEELDLSSMQHVGKTGRFIPVNFGGGRLLRVKDGKSYAVTGTKDHLWIEAEMAKNLEDLSIDTSYHDRLAEQAKDAIDYFGSFNNFVK